MFLIDSEICFAFFNESLSDFSSGFPGCQPVSMDTSNIKLLQEKPYSVSWKADGTRYVEI